MIKEYFSSIWETAKNFSDYSSCATRKEFWGFILFGLLLGICVFVISYIVRITNESGNVVYEKAINAGSIVALSIDISAYAKGRYTVTVENSSESFSGEFDTQTTGIKEVNSNVTRTVQYYSIDGKRIATPQRGLNIIRTSDGKMKKVVVK